MIMATKSIPKSATIRIAYLTWATNGRKEWVIKTKPHTRSTSFPNIFGERRSPNDIRTRGNGGTVAFPQIGLQRNAKPVVKVNGSFIIVKCLISYIAICH